MTSQGLEPGQVIWLPEEGKADHAPVTAFRRWVEQTRGVALSGYDELWRWSTDDVGAFWLAVWEWFGVTSPTPFSDVVTGAMPSARWFSGASLNYAEQVFRQTASDRPALVVCHEDEEPRLVSWEQLGRDVGALTATLERLGVQPGDRVAGYIPNRYEAVVALLAAASRGAIWSLCAPDFGAESALARLRQIDAKVLIAVDGYRFGGHHYDRSSELRDVVDALPTVETTIVIRTGSGGGAGPRREVLEWDEALHGDSPLTFAAVPFEHPLWVLFSSGTTGVPKGIVHSHGGIVLEHLKALSLGQGLTPGDKYYFYSATSWMVWNYLVGGLLVGAVPVLYDGSPSYPDVGASWRVAAAADAAVVGFGAAYISACARAGLSLRDGLVSTALTSVISTGSPLPIDGWRWLRRELPAGVRIDCSSGGTDICSGLVGGSPVLAVTVGELSGRMLGVAAEAWDDDGRPVVDEVGELVITRPMPSMPVRFWNDPDGGRYADSYFAKYPDVWCHGDWVRISARGSVQIEGRSDSTLNRGGVRMGSADIYNVVDAVDGIDDSLVLGVELPDGEYYMPLFVVPGAGRTLDDDLAEAIRAAIRTALSKRHLPDAILAAPAVPRTKTGKRLEVPIKRLFQGVALDRSVDLRATDDPDTVRWFADIASRWRAARAHEPSGGSA